MSKPLYSVRFNTLADIESLNVAPSSPVYYIQDLVNLVLTQPLKSQKGSDASNLYDEEVAANEMEFSDDEKEMEFKKASKAKKRRDNPRHTTDETTLYEPNIRRESTRNTDRRPSRPLTQTPYSRPSSYARQEAHYPTSYSNAQHYPPSQPMYGSPHGYAFPAGQAYGYPPQGYYPPMAHYMQQYPVSYEGHDPNRGYQAQRMMMQNMSMNGQTGNGYPQSGYPSAASYGNYLPSERSPDGYDYTRQ